MIVKVIVEETVAEEFEFEIPKGINPYNYISELYYKEKIKLEPGECKFRKMKIYKYEDTCWSEWQEF